MEKTPQGNTKSVSDEEKHESPNIDNTGEPSSTGREEPIDTTTQKNEPLVSAEKDATDESKSAAAAHASHAEEKDTVDKVSEL